ncbi:MAG: iron-containing redox enzyme family protein [Candidatus Magasanikbacteria bacterium]|nr:iron-containing redox enzyme family protein [Candidatus Magasanikbacteria bacterium]
MQRVNERLKDLRDQVACHPVGRVKLPRAALEAFAVAQYRDSDVWLGWFIKMMDMVQNPALKAALAHNFMDEAGAVEGVVGQGVSHMTLCLRFIRSLGLEPGNAVANGLQVSAHAEALIQLIPGMSEAEVAGWVLGTEELVPALFSLFLPKFEALGGVDTEYLTTHIQVDVGDHAIEMRKGCASVLEENPDCIDEMLSGINLAGRFTCAVPDMIRVTYAKVSSRRAAQNPRWGLSNRANALLDTQLPHSSGRGGC